jgi:hypothetical protein
MNSSAREIKRDFAEETNIQGSKASAISCKHKTPLQATHINHGETNIAECR